MGDQVLMEWTRFPRNTRRKRRGERLGRSSATEIVVNMHLCEVLWQDPPPEAGRNPTWFSPEKTKRRLQSDRAASHATNLVRVVGRALIRIQRLQGDNGRV